MCIATKRPSPQDLILPLLSASSWGSVTVPGLVGRDSHALIVSIPFNVSLPTDFRLTGRLVNSLPLIFLAASLESSVTRLSSCLSQTLAAESRQPRLAIMASRS